MKHLRSKNALKHLVFTFNFSLCYYSYSLFHLKTKTQNQTTETILDILDLRVT